MEFLGYQISAREVKMDDRKTSWPTPKSVKELQRFLGFANFYRRFIDHYSMITTPLTSLLKGKPKILQWTPEAEQAFQALKTAFTRAPLLQHPDPEKKFIVKVDTSTTGVGAILSQYSKQAAKPMPMSSSKDVPSVQ